MRCTDGHEHDTVSPWDITGGHQWYECLRCGTRVKADASTPVVCPQGCQCDRPAVDHPTEVERMLGQAHPANAYRDPYRIDPNAEEPERHPLIEAPASHPEHAHSAHDDPCAYPLAMRKLVGFLCVECGSPIEGLPAKSYE